MPSCRARRVHARRATRDWRRWFFRQVKRAFALRAHARSKSPQTRIHDVARSRCCGDDLGGDGEQRESSAPWASATTWRRAAADVARRWSRRLRRQGACSSSAPAARLGRIDRISTAELILAEHKVWQQIASRRDSENDGRRGDRPLHRYPGRSNAGVSNDSQTSAIADRRAADGRRPRRRVPVMDANDLLCAAQCGRGSSLIKGRGLVPPHRQALFGRSSPPKARRELRIGGDRGRRGNEDPADDVRRQWTYLGVARDSTQQPLRSKPAPRANAERRRVRAWAGSASASGARAVQPRRRGGATRGTERRAAAAAAPARRRTRRRRVAVIAKPQAPRAARRAAADRFQRPPRRSGAPRRQCRRRAARRPHRRRRRSPWRRARRAPRSPQRPRAAPRPRARARRGPRRSRRPRAAAARASRARPRRNRRRVARADGRADQPEARDARARAARRRRARDAVLRDQLALRVPRAERRRALRRHEALAARPRRRGRGARRRHDAHRRDEDEERRRRARRRRRRGGATSASTAATLVARSASYGRA